LLIFNLRTGCAAVDRIPRILNFIHSFYNICA
jgi:hypothetical protein